MVELGLTIWLMCAILCAELAGSKKRSRIGWFLAGVLFGPLALAILICLENK